MKDLYEPNHNTDQFAEERETVIHYADAQPIAHDVREIEKKKGVVQNSWVNSQTRKLLRHSRNEQTPQTQHQK